MDFNKPKIDYQSTIDQSIRFSGKTHDFFTKVKAEFLKAVIKKNGFSAPPVCLLEIGCDGFIHRLLSKEEFEITGVDIVDEVLVLAKKNNSQVN